MRRAQSDGPVIDGESAEKEAIYAAPSVNRQARSAHGEHDIRPRNCFVKNRVAER